MQEVKQLYILGEEKPMMIHIKQKMLRLHQLKTLIYQKVYFKGKDGIKSKKWKKKYEKEQKDDIAKTKDKEEKEGEDIPEIKTILLGESGVGKSNLANTSIDLRFDPNSKSTINPIFVFIFQKNFELKLLDTAGLEQYRALKNYFIKIHRKSFEELNYWIKEIKDNLGDERYIW